MGQVWDSSGASREAMIKIRTRNKHLVVIEAHLRVYDKYEKRRSQ